MKKVLSLCLALCMAFTLAAPALAEAVLTEGPLEEAPLTEADALPAEAPLLDVEAPQEESGEEVLEEEPKGSSLISPVNISVNQWVNGYTVNSDSVDYYRFTLSQPGVVSFSFRHTREDSSRYWYVSLGYESNGSFYTYTRQRIELRNMAEITSYKVGLPAGTYYVEVDPSRGTGSNVPMGRSYSVKANYIASSQWETEWNNAMITTADPIQAGRTYYGTSLNSDDLDYFRFTVPQRSTVTLTFNHTRESENRYWYVSIGYDNNGTFSSIERKKITLNSDASTTLSATLATGTYYIEVDPSRGTSSNVPEGREYNFTLTGIVDPAQLRGFVTRLYDKCLGRQPDASGMNTWVGVLADGSWTAERVAWGFVFSKEYINKHTSNDAYVRMLYRVYMDREADSSGYNTWINALNSGWSREQVMQGFSRSVEFKNICARYGMTPW